MEIDPASGDKSDWLRNLISHLPADEVPELRDRATRAVITQEDGSGSDGSVPAHLLRFYVDEAIRQTQSPEAKAVQEAHDRLSFIRDGLIEHSATASDRVAIKGLPASSGGAAGAAALLPVPTDHTDLADAIRLTYRKTVRRDAVDEEVDIWKGNFANGLAFHEFLLMMDSSEEAARQQAADSVGEGLSDGEFVLALYLLVWGRGCNGYELDAVRRRLEAGGISRSRLLAEFFMQAHALAASGSDFTVHDGLSCSIMGTPGFLSLEEWQERGRDTEALAAARDGLRRSRPYRLSASPGVRVSAIASLFRGGDFIEQFMDNITTQTIFDRSCELIIVDAASDENEAETIRRYLDTHPGVRYQRMNSRVGIYEAWNIGVEMARGEFLTNTNLDDLRRQDSLEIQAGALEALPFVDVVYQDFYYSFDPTLDWDGVAAFGYKSELPLVTNHNMLRFNSPHNAPMWRKTLHDELGLFDANFKSAGDYEFWLRCLAAGKTFHKINEPHVVYYQNPKGLSTRADTRGILEAKEIGRKYTQALMPAPLLRRFEGFIKDDIATGLDPASFPARDRHVAVQKALRDTARQFKTGGA